MTWQRRCRIWRSKNKDAKLHIKLDTGMSRIGFLCDEKHAPDTIREIKRIASLPNLEIDGIFTHLSCADEDEGAYTRMQFERFMHICDSLQTRACRLASGMSATARALVLYPEMQLDMVRPGVILYGLHPSPLTEEKSSCKAQ